jgi:hypothetical protein
VSTSMLVDSRDANDVRMRDGRMSQRIRRSSWGRLLTEGLAIVASILLAFGIDAWWDDAQARSAEKEFLQTLHSELTTGRDYLVRQIEIHKNILARAKELVEFGQSGGLDQLPRDSSATIVFYRYNSTRIDTGALDGVLGSGRLGLISDQRVRSRLGAWPAALDELREEEDGARSFVEAVLLVVTPHIPAPGTFRGDTEPFPESAAPFLRSTEGRNLAAVRAQIETQAVRDGQRLLALLENLLGLLQDDLSR